jgi:hypothetical protein
MTSSGQIFAEVAEWKKAKRARRGLKSDMDSQERKTLQDARRRASRRHLGARARTRPVGSRPANARTLDDRGGARSPSRIPARFARRHP